MVKNISHHCPFNVVSNLGTLLKKAQTSLYCTIQPSSVDLPPHLVKLDAGSLAVEVVRVGGSTHRPQQAVQAGQHSTIV
jgi:hypothetical protein